MKDSFLNEAKIGSCVEVIVGPKNIQGIVVSLDTSVVQIKKNDGKISTVSLDAVSFFEFIEEGEDGSAFPVKTETTRPSISQSASQVGVPSSPTIEKKQSNVGVSSSTPASPRDVFKILEDSDVTFFQKLDKPRVKTWSDIARAEESPRLRSNLLAIANSLDFAMNQNHEASPTDYKIRENIQKLKKMKTDGVGGKSIANMLGALYYQCKCDRLALEAYEEGDDNESAFVVAESISSDRYMEKFACRHLVNDGVLNAYIIKHLVLWAIGVDDYSIVSRLFVSLTNDSKVPGVVAFIKALFVSKGKDGVLYYDNSRDSMKTLISLYLSTEMGSRFKMAENIVEIFPPENDSSEEKNRISYISAASEAKERNLYDLAEKLYLFAIENGDNPTVSLVDLIEMLIQNDNFDKAAHYFKEYGERYLYEFPERYKYFYKELYSKYPKINADIMELGKQKQEIHDRANTSLRNRKIEKKEWKKSYTNVEKEREKTDEKTNYIKKAREADSKKDLDKAISFYKLAIENNQNVSACVLDLAMIYNRRSEFDEALKLLENYKDCLEERKYLNLKIVIFTKAKDSKYKEDIIKTFEQLRSLPNTPERDLMIAEGCLLNRINDPERAIGIFNKVLDIFDDNYTLNEQEIGKKINVLKQLCTAYIILNKSDEAKIHAEEILKIKPEDKNAKAIISGDKIDYTKAEDKDEYDIFSIIYSFEISDFFKNMISKCDLTIGVKNRTLINKGVYTGTEKNASNIIKDILQNQVPTIASEETKSNTYFVVAKLIRQILDRNKSWPTEDIDDYINVNQYQRCVAVGCFIWGRYVLSEFLNYDTARFCFLQVIKLFEDPKNIGHRHCWTSAISFYIDTFFKEQNQLRNLKRNGIYFDFENEERIDTELDGIIGGLLDSKRKVKSPDIEFIVAMIEMLKYNPYIKGIILYKLFNHSNRDDFVKAIQSINGTSDIIIEFDQFEQLWEAVTKKYFNKKDAFSKIIEDTISSTFDIGELERNVDNLKRDCFRQLLNKTDQAYVKVFEEDIISKIIKYRKESQFESKMEILRNVNDKTEKLEEYISQSPTWFSLEILLSKLNGLKKLIHKESEEQYGKSKPELSVELVSDSVSITENKVIAPIRYLNKSEQKVQIKSINIIPSDKNKIRINNNDLSQFTLQGNNQPYEVLVEFGITPKILESRAFDVKFLISYSYKKTLTDHIDNQESFTIAIPLYSNKAFVPIYNRFQEYTSGSEVKDNEMFFGRDEEINNIIKLINDNSGQGKCLALYGQKRTGKSSLLYHVKETLIKNDEEKRQENFIIINFGSLGSIPLSLGSFCRTFLNILQTEIEKRHSKLNKLLQKNNIKIKDEKYIGFSNDDIMLEYFLTTMEKVVDIAENSNSGYRFIIMIDEFTYLYDYIIRGEMNQRFMQFWKAIIPKYRFFAIIIGQDHMLKFINMFPNEFGAIQTLKVTYLSEENAKKMISEPILLTDEYGNKSSRFQPGALDRIFKLTAGSAYLIMILCYNLVEYLNNNKITIVTQAHIEDYLSKNLNKDDFLEIYFDPQFSDKSDPNKETEISALNKIMLNKIAFKSNSSEWTYKSEVIITDSDRDIYQSLVDRDVIIDKSDRCKIKVELYKEWILKNEEPKY